MIDELLQALKELNSNQEIWDAIATTYRNAYDALIRAGFSSDQAMTIISRQGAGVKPS